MELQKAKLAAHNITQYWAHFGLHVRAVVVQEYAAQKGQGSHFNYTVRTQPPLVGGFPAGITLKQRLQIARAKTQPPKMEQD